MSKNLIDDTIFTKTIVCFLKIGSDIWLSSYLRIKRGEIQIQIFLGESFVVYFLFTRHKRFENPLDDYDILINRFEEPTCFSKIA